MSYMGKRRSHLSCSHLPTHTRSLFFFLPFIYFSLRGGKLFSFFFFFFSCRFSYRTDSDARYRKAKSGIIAQDLLPVKNCILAVHTDWTFYSCTDDATSRIVAHCSRIVVVSQGNPGCGLPEQGSVYDIPRHGLCLSVFQIIKVCSSSMQLLHW